MVAGNSFRVVVLLDRARLLLLPLFEATATDLAQRNSTFLSDTI